MWPWAHAAVGYLAYTLYLRATAGARPLGPAVLTLAVGTQLPDLVDKPLAWYVHVLPYGRSFAHSLLTGVPLLLVPVAVLLGTRVDWRTAGAFALGYLSHLVADGYLAILTGEWRDLAYLAWPLVPPPPSEVEGLLRHLQNIEGDPQFLFGLLLTGIATGVWVWHGRPGLATLRDWAGAAVPTRS